MQSLIHHALVQAGDVLVHGKRCILQVNPFEPEVDWFTRDKEIHSLWQAPEPKRRFMPSKWEEKKCACGSVNA
jgi:hypothetical protein